MRGLIRPGETECRGASKASSILQCGQERCVGIAELDSGRVAIQVGKRFGAAHVVGARRDAARLAELSALGTDRTYALDELADAADADVVIDYVWGEATARAIVDMLAARADRSAPLTWIQVGSVAGPEAAILFAALRSAQPQIVGSGIGSVLGRDFIKELPTWHPPSPTERSTSEPVPCPSQTSSRSGPQPPEPPTASFSCGEPHRRGTGDRTLRTESEPAGHR